MNFFIPGLLFAGYHWDSWDSKFLTPSKTGVCVQNRQFLYCKNDINLLFQLMGTDVKKTKHFLFSQSTSMDIVFYCWNQAIVLACDPLLLSLIFPSGSERGRQKHLLELRHTAATRLIWEPCSTLAVQKQGDGLFCLLDL